MNNLTKTVELLTAIALCDDEEYKKKLLVSLKELSCDTEPKLSMEETVISMLTELGVPSSVSGYDHMVYAICAIANNPGLKHTITGELYPMVAKAFNSCDKRVERTMRHAITVAFDRCDVDVVHKYFGNTISPYRGKPTNSEFLSRLADEVRWRVNNV